jgi:hypothetical protein
MAEIASAYVTLIPSLKGSSGTIAKELGGAGKSGGAAASKGFKGSFMSGVKSLAGPVAGLIGVSAGIGFLKDANAEAREAQKIGALTESTIKATGGAAKVTAKQVGDLAGAISAKTGIDDETIQSGQNMLLTFKNIRNEAGKGNDIFDQTSKTLVDMATAMGTEPKQAAIQLGKALNDPVKGISALSRVGVTFTDKQKAVNKALVEGGDANALMALGLVDSTTTFNNLIKQQGGDVAKTVDMLTNELSPAQQKLYEHYTEGGHAIEAQKVLLKELNSEFGGAAEAQATAGDKAAVAFGNLKEQIGTALLPVVDKLATVATEKVIPAVSKFIEQIQNGEGAGGKFVDALEAIKGGLEDAWDILKPVIGFLVDNKEAVATFAGILLTVAAAVKVWTGAQLLLNVALTANPVGIIVVAIAALAAGLVIAWKKSETFRNAVKLLAIGFVELGKWGIQAFRFLLTAAFNTFDGILSAAEKGLGWIPGLGDKISGAREAFRNFGDATIAKLKGVEDRLTGVQQKIAGIPASKTFTLNMVTVKSTQDKNDIGEFGGPRRAMGGPVARGTTYLVGERGPELFTAAQAGRIIPNDQIGSTAGGSNGGGVTFRIDTVRAHNYDDFLRQMNRHARAAAGGGVRF